MAFSGLVGAGRSEVARAIFGADRSPPGEITFDGKPVRFRSPADAIRAGIAMVQEDRKVLSLFMNMSIEHNMTMAQLPFMSTGMTSDRRERRLADEHGARAGHPSDLACRPGQQPERRQPAEDGAGALAGDQARSC